MSIFDKIKQFKKENPQVSEEKVDELVKNLVAFSMQCIVSNEELNGHASGAWLTIQETFGVEVKDDLQMLPLNRSQSSEVNDAFKKACTDENIEGIKEGLKKFARINYDADTSILTDMAIIGNLKALRFFIENDFIKHNQIYKKQVDFESTKGKIFEMAYFYQRREIVEYLIYEHNAELTPEGKAIIKRDNKGFRKDVLAMIENKYLKFMLEMNLDSKTDIKPKNKI